ncbi:hypothetical protein D3C86_1686820 [compost metagenome]
MSDYPCATSCQLVGHALVDMDVPPRAQQQVGGEQASQRAANDGSFTHGLHDSLHFHAARRRRLLLLRRDSSVRS